MLKNLKKFYWIGFGMALSLVLSGLMLAASPERVKVWAANAPAGDVLAHETLSSLGKFKQAGNVTLPDNFAAQFGTNKIQWGAGQRPVDTIPVGVWNSAFKVGQLSPAQINPTQNMDAAGLTDYGFLKNMPIKDLATGLPLIAQMNIADVKPLADLVALKVAEGSMTTPITGTGLLARPAVTVADLISVPGWSDVQLPTNLSSYAASDLPGLANTPISNFPKVLANPASAFPGLANMPIANMPGFNLPAGYQIGYFDSIRTKEPAIRKVISGSREQPNAICESKNCNHAEVQAMIGGVLSGAQIVDGDTQTVSGGYGFLRAIASTEKAGMQPYGEPIQEVYANFNAQSGDVDRSWYFNVCNHGWIDWGCSAHFIGPIPIGSLHEGSKTPLLLGNISIPIQAPKIKASTVGKILAAPAPTTTSASPATAIPVASAPVPTPLNLSATTNKIAAVLPQASTAQITLALQNQANKIDPTTGQTYSNSVILRHTVEQLMAGNNSPVNNNATSLSLGQTVDEIVKQIQ